MSRALPRARQIFEALRRHGLTLPGAREDHPWGEVVLKAKDKVFVFLGRPDEGKCGFSLKLPESGEGMLDQDFAQPTGYGLGKSGWITFDFAPGQELPESELIELLEESYRAVASKTLLKELDARRGGATDAKPAPTKPAARKPAAKKPAPRKARAKRR